MSTERTLSSGKLIAVSCLIIVLFLMGVVLKLAKSVLFPFLLAVFLSFLLKPVVNLMTRIKIPRAVAILLVLLLTFYLVYLLGVVFYASGKAFASEFPKYGEKVRAAAEYLQQKYNLSGLKGDPLVLLKSLDVSKIGSLFLSSLGPFFSFLSNLFLVLIFLVFILAGQGMVKRKLEAALPRAHAARMEKIIRNINYQIQRYLAIKTLSNFFVALFSVVVMVLFGLDFAVLFGVMTFVFGYIPQLGAIISTVLPMVIAAFQFSSLWPALWLGILLTIIQNVFGNFVEPKLMGRGLGLSPLVVLFSLFFWGWLWGIAGMVLAVPFMAVIKIVCQNIPELKFVAVLMSSGN